MKSVFIGSLYLLFSYFVVIEDLLATVGDDVKFSGQWFLHYQQSAETSQFKMSRSYFTLKNKITDSISGRITLDAHQVDNGDYSVRLKYVYALFYLKSGNFITNPTIEFGLVHRTWLDFEEHLNYYRLQGTMFMERNHLFNSADAGLTFNFLLGGLIGEDYRKNVNPGFPGRYGSFSVGLYNGGGYHALEENKAKNMETRLTLRPFPGVIPGFQLSCFLSRGKGNTETEPEYSVNALFMSFESPLITFTGTYYSGRGNSAGEDEKDRSGYSLFGELKFRSLNTSLISRYDLFDPDIDVSEDANSRIILGIAYQLPYHSKILIDYDFTDYEDSGHSTEGRLKVSMELHF